MTKRVEGAGLNLEQGLNTKSPDAMRHTAPGMANFNIYNGGVDGSPPAGGVGAASASEEILQGESFAEQTPMPGQQG